MMDVKDQAEEIRNALKAEYPDTKFSLTTKRGGLDERFQLNGWTYRVSNRLSRSPRITEKLINVNSVEIY
ncbi:LPD29 domain-containing protein [Alkalihalobacillus sp. NPDC078783]